MPTGCVSGIRQIALAWHSCAHAVIGLPEHTAVGRALYRFGLPKGRGLVLCPQHSPLIKVGRGPPELLLEELGEVLCIFEAYSVSHLPNGLVLSFQEQQVGLV